MEKNIQSIIDQINTELDILGFNPVEEDEAREWYPDLFNREVLLPGDIRNVVRIVHEINGI